MKDALAPSSSSIAMCWSRGKNHIPQPPSRTSSGILLALFAAKAHCWLICSLMTASTPVLIYEDDFQLVGHSLMWFPGFVPPQVQNFLFPFDELQEVPASAFLQPMGVLLKNIKTMQSVKNSQFVSSLNLMRVHSYLPSTGLINWLGAIGPNILPWDTPLMTSLNVPLISTLSAQQFLQLLGHLRIQWSILYFMSLQHK